ncbi:MAG TPA: AraC family transcriptional regulator [Gemmataceae bacterium]|nr:AraC family transcriptional regulator [Gemmataceae bacterium]
MKAKRSEQVYLSRINRVIDYINAHLTDPLPLEKLARLAHFSPFHFHRIFRSLTGEPLHAFIRRLRLERAVFQMAHGPAATLTDIALRCGFGSSSDFSRAFRQTYGFRPRDYSRERFLETSKIRQDLWANTRYDSARLSRGRNPDRFRVRLVDRPAQRIAYVRVIGGYNAEKILGGFHRLMDWGRQHGLVPGATLIGMSQDDPDITPMAKYRFDWCLVLPDSQTPDGDLRVIPAGRFAALHCRGDIHKVDRAWQYLFLTWLPHSGYQPAQQPAMEVFHAHPLEIGWSSYDIDCCLPVKPLPKC